MIKLFLAVSLMLLSQSLTSLEYGLFAKKEGSQPITKFSIHGERCSGTNYIQALITNNIDIKKEEFSHKHTGPWYDLPIEHWLGDPKHYTFEGTEDQLCIIIFRNPYDWARSFNKNPWMAAGKLFKLPFSKFIRSEWEVNLVDNKNVINLYALNHLVDRNPIDGSAFKNIFELRTDKIRNMLMIKDRAKNAYYINYEIARDYPQKVIEEIGAIFSLNIQPLFRPVNNYKGGNTPYQEKIYEPISNEDLLYINSQLDGELENQIGYQLRSLQ